MPAAMRKMGNSNRSREANFAAMAAENIAAALSMTRSK